MKVKDLIFYLFWGLVILGVLIVLIRKMFSKEENSDLEIGVIPKEDSNKSDNVSKDGLTEIESEKIPSSETAKIVSESLKNCENCKGQVLRQSQFLDECGKAGLLLIDGNLYGGKNDQKKTEIFQDLENQKGFRCSTCSSIYCMACLFNFAPAHSNGGKACFKCKGRFERYE